MAALRHAFVLSMGGHIPMNVNLTYINIAAVSPRHISDPNLTRKDLP